MQSKPVIGLSPKVDSIGDPGVRSGYLSGVRQSGGVPLIFPLGADEEEGAQLCRLCDGFILTGGPDVDPRFYGEESLPEMGEISPARDTLEFMIFAQAMKADKPVLGVCRGVQMLNVALGGTLYQDLPTQQPSSIAHRQSESGNQATHVGLPTEDSPLRSISSQAEWPVNSFHHQAIKDPAPSLKVMAHAPDGVIEAVYRPESRFMWGVQWHPELTLHDGGMSQGLFDAFVEACRKDRQAMDTLTIEPVTEQNLLQAAHVHALSWRESHKAVCTPEFLAAHDDLRQAAYIRRAMTEGKRFFLLKNPVPCAVVAVKDNTISDLYVLPDRQGCGLGSAMLAHALRQCSAAPRLTVLSTNHRARDWYYRRGFRESGVRIPLKNGLYEAEMTLISSQPSSL